MFAENLTEQGLAERSFYPNGTYGYSMSPSVPAVIAFQRPVQLHYMYLKQHRSPQYFMKKSYGHHEIRGYFNGKLVLQGSVVLFSNLWKQFMPAESGVVVDKVVLPSMVDFDSMMVGVDSLQPYHIANQNKRVHPSPLLEKVFITKDMLRKQTDPFIGQPIPQMAE